MIGSLGQPLLFLVALGFGFGPVYSKAGQGNFIQFLTPGIIAMSVLFTAVFSGIEIIWDRQFGFLKETLAAPVSRLNIMIGRTLGGATVATLQGMVVLVLSYVVGFRITDWPLMPVALFIMLLMALLFTALGTAIASVVEDFQGFQLISNFLVMPVFFLSGALFPLEGLPGLLKTITRINPLSYAVDGLRYTLANVHQFALYTDFSVLVVVTAVLLLLGSYMFTKIQI